MQKVQYSTVQQTAPRAVASSRMNGGGRVAGLGDFLGSVSKGVDTLRALGCLLVTYKAVDVVKQHVVG